MQSHPDTFNSQGKTNVMKNLTSLTIVTIQYGYLPLSFKILVWLTQRLFPMPAFNNVPTIHTLKYLILKQI